MVIGNRDAVVAGTKLVASYKKTDYVCEVRAGEDGKLAFVYDGKSYSSPSAAGTAIIGTACNGWRFWSIEGEAPAVQPAAKAATPRTKTSAKAATAKRKTGTRKRVKVFYRIPGITDTAEGTRFYCNACAAAFQAETESPEACPQGHRNDDPELSGAPSPEAVAADKLEAAAE